MLFPLLKSDDLDNLLEHVLQLVLAVVLLLELCSKCPLNDGLIEVGEHFVLFQHHGARP